MNIIFLCSLICLSSSSVLNQLAPLKKIMNKSLITIAPLKKIANKQLIDLIIDHQKDPAYLLSVLSNVDPTQLNAVIVLIRVLLADSESDLTALNLASTNANTAYTDATVAYDSAVLARSRLETAYTDDNVRRETAYTAQSAVLDQQVNELFVVQTEAHGAKTNAQGTFDTEKIRLNGEIETLKQVITLLEGLGGSTSVPQNGLYSWFKQSSANAVWPSSIGNWEGVAHGVVPTVVTEAGNGAIVPITYLTGTTKSGFSFGQIVPDTFTLCSMSRYTNTNAANRILQSLGNDWFHGHWDKKAGMNFYTDWNCVYGSSGVSPSTDWLIMCGSSDSSQAIYVNGVAISDHSHDGTAPPNLGFLHINPIGGVGFGDWAVAEVITWDRVLTVNEIEEVSAKMRKDLSG